jgi:hypothetical protein
LLRVVWAEVVQLAFFFSSWLKSVSLRHPSQRDKQGIPNTPK